MCILQKVILNYICIRKGRMSTESNCNFVIKSNMKIEEVLMETHWFGVRVSVKVILLSLIIISYVTPM